MCPFPNLCADRAGQHNASRGVGRPCGKALSKRGCLHWHPSPSPFSSLESEVMLEMEQPCCDQEDIGTDQRGQCLLASWKC